MSDALHLGRPMEAYHEDGRVVPARYGCSASGGTVEIWFNGGYHNALMPSGYIGDGWRIRNVAEPAQAYIRIPMTGDLAKRMEALVRDMAAMPCKNKYPDVVIGRAARIAFNEARAIVALLPEPVDADLVEARSIIADAFRDYSGDEGDDSARMVEEGKMDDAGSVKRIVDYARRIRALERDSREG